MYPLIQLVIDKIDYSSIAESRKKELHVLVDYIQQKVATGKPVLLNFICTHNSRRSQFSQLWGQVAADYYGITIESFSGGVEVTAFNERAVDSLIRFGFHVEKQGSENPHYIVRWNTTSAPLTMFSKLYDDPANPVNGFAAIMTCSHADENCPYVNGCDLRIPIRYNDPKEFDDSPRESEMYDKRSFEIATELMFVFSQIEK